MLFVCAHAVVQVVVPRSLSAFVATEVSATVMTLAGKQPAANKRALQMGGINAQKLASGRIERDREPIEGASPGAA